jgi:hypothetical protein
MAMKTEPLVTRLRGWLDSGWAGAEESAPGLIAAVQAVLELHKPQPCAEECCTWCVECDRIPKQFVPWPCETVRAIARALDVPIEGDQQ